MSCSLHPHPGGGWRLYADHRHADPRLIRTRRLMIKIPEISQLPHYHQSEEGPPAVTLTPKTAFKNCPPKAIGEWGSSEHELPILLAWHSANACCIFSHYNPMLVDRLFCMVGRADPNSVCSNIIIFVMNIVTYQTYMMWPCFEAGGRRPPPITPRADNPR